MDLIEFCELYRQVLHGLRGRLENDECDDRLTDLDTGEEALAVEFLMGTLIRREIPVSRTEVATLLELMRWFDISPSDADADDFYTALTDPDGTAAELTVVDEPSW